MSHITNLQRVHGFAVFAILLTSCVTQPSAVSISTAEPTSAPPTPAPVNVHVWETAGDRSKLLEPQDDVSFKLNLPENGKPIYVNENHHYQQMDGFGASMTDSSAW